MGTVAEWVRLSALYQFEWMVLTLNPGEGIYAFELGMADKVEAMLLASTHCNK